MLDLNEKVCKILAKDYGYLPGSVKQLTGFVKIVHNFTSYLGSNKYYSDSLNKRLALLAIDTDILSLKAERARLQAEGFYAQIELAVMTKGKPKLDKKAVEEFKKHYDELLAQALAVNERALKLMEDIKSEYA